MKSFVLVFLLVASLALLGPNLAFAKGASEATLEGPGLSSPITFSGSGEPDSGAPVWRIAEDSGFYAAVFDESLASRVTEPPTSELGPRYTMTYVMPGPAGDEDRIVQDIYPYALPSPVAFVGPDQPFFGDRRTQGGWFVAASFLKDQLVAAGLPRIPPSGGDGPGFPWTLVGVLSAPVLAVVVAALSATRIRRGRQTRTVTA